MHANVHHYTYNTKGHFVNLARWEIYESEMAALSAACNYRISYSYIFYQLLIANATSITASYIII